MKRSVMGVVVDVGKIEKRISELEEKIKKEPTRVFVGWLYADEAIAEDIVRGYMALKKFRQICANDLADTPDEIAELERRSEELEIEMRDWLFDLILELEAIRFE